MDTSKTLNLIGIEAIANLLDHYHFLWFHSVFEKEEIGFKAFFSGVDFSKLSDVKRKKILSLLEESSVRTALVEYFSSAAVEFIFEHYQFLQLNAQDESSLKKIYEDLLNRITALLHETLTLPRFEMFLTELLKGHFNELKAFIQHCFARNYADNGEEAIQVPGTICHEYSPELQLKILIVDLENLVEPVLDIGCGKSGKLVKLLTEKGIKAFGVDRIVENSDLFVRSEWLKFPMQNNMWGTIIAHMSFSNHFIFHHLYKYGTPEKYAQKYMEILDSLKIGGSFYYSPGLPFLETYLPESKYSLQKSKVEAPGTDSNKMHALLEQDVFYSCKVQKIDS